MMIQNAETAQICLSLLTSVILQRIRFGEDPFGLEDWSRDQIAERIDELVGLGLLAKAEDGLTVAEVPLEFGDNSEVQKVFTAAQLDRNARYDRILRRHLSSRSNCFWSTIDLDVRLDASDLTALKDMLAREIQKFVGGKEASPIAQITHIHVGMGPAAYPDSRRQHG